MKKIRGTTLIELLLSLALSLILMTLLCSLYLGLQTSQQEQDDLAKLELSSSLAVQMLKQDLHLAGFIGCPFLSRDFPLINHTRLDFSAQSKIKLAPRQISLTYRTVVANFLAKGMRSKNHLQLSSAAKFSPGTYLLISNCVSAELFQIKSLRGQELVTTAALDFAYPAGTEVGELKIKTYSLEKTTRFDRLGQSIWGLYLQEFPQPKMELLSGVEDLQFSLQNEDQGMAFSFKLRENRQRKKVYGFVALGEG